MTVSMGVIGGLAAVAQLERLRNVDGAMIAVQRSAERGRSMAVNNASGAPGPNVRSGDYIRSFTAVVERQPNAIVGYIGTNKPQARRLEIGYTGTDSAGRTYNDKPRPHWGPVHDALPEILREELAAALL